MRNEWNADAIGLLIRRTLPLFGLPPDAPMHMTGWIRCGYQHCRRFDCGAIQAVWFLEEEQLRFYRSDRTLVHTIRLDELRRRDRDAA